MNNCKTEVWKYHFSRTVGFKIMKNGNKAIREY